MGMALILGSNICPNEQCEQGEADPLTTSGSQVQFELPASCCATCRLECCALSPYPLLKFIYKMN